MTFVPLTSGASVPLRLQLGGGETGLFPQAHVYNRTTFAEVAGSPFTLSHQVLGLYSADVASLADAYYIAVYKVYTDAGHTVASGVYPSTTVDDFRLSPQLALDSTVAKASVLGTPAGASIAADLAEIEGETDAIIATLGTPAGASLAADLAEIEGETDAIIATQGTPAGASISADIAAVRTAIGSPAGASLSADVAAVKSVEDTINVKIGAPAGASLSADVASVKSDTSTTVTRIGSPAGVSLAADLAEIEGETDAIIAAVGTPAGASLSADVAAVKAVIGAPAGASIAADIAEIEGETDAIIATLGNPVGSSLSADIANVQATENTINTKIGAPAGASLSADVAAVKGDTTLLTGRLTAGRALNLDNLDAAVSLTETAAVAATQTAAIQSSVANVLSAVQAIQNNTTFSGVVPAIMDVPNVGSEAYKFFATLQNTDGAPLDPDAQHLNYQVTNTAGTVLQATTLMTRTGTGVYTGGYTVNAGDAENDVIVTFTWAVAATNFTAYRTSKITPDAGELATLVSRLTATRAANLDKIDVVLSTRTADADDLARYNNILAAEATTQAAVAGVQTKLGVPVSGTVSLDIAAVRVQTDKIGNPATGTVAGDAAAIRATLGTPAGASLAADLAEIEGETDAITALIGTPAGASLAADLAEIEGETDQLIVAIGTPAASVSADIAAVKGDTATTVTRIGSPANGSLAADVAEVESETDAIITTLGSPAGMSLADDLASVKSDSSTLRTRLTATRAANLDYLDDPISGLETDVAANARVSAVLTAVGGVEATLGAPAGASVSADIAAIKSDSAQVALINTKIGNPVSSVSTDLAAVKADTGGLRADLTTPRAANLDKLDATITSREAESDALARYTALPGLTSDEVWDEPASEHRITGSFGASVGNPPNLTDEIRVALSNNEVTAAVEQNSITVTVEDEEVL